MKIKILSLIMFVSSCFAADGDTRLFRDDGSGYAFGSYTITDQSVTLLENASVNDWLVDLNINTFFADPATNSSFDASAWRGDLGYGTLATEDADRISATLEPSSSNTIGAPLNPWANIYGLAVTLGLTPTGPTELTTNSLGQLLIDDTPVLTTADIGSSAGQIPVLAQDYAPFTFLVYDSTGGIIGYDAALAREELALGTAATRDTGAGFGQIMIVSDDPADGELLSFGAGGIQGSSPAETRTWLNVEDGADVTDPTNVAAAGAVMTAGTQTISGDKSYTGTVDFTDAFLYADDFQSEGTGFYFRDAFGSIAATISDTGTFSGQLRAQDVTDAGAFMDSESANLPALKAFDADAISADKITTGMLSLDRLPDTIEASLIPRNGPASVIDTVVLDTAELAWTTDTEQIRVGDNVTGGGGAAFGSLGGSNSWSGPQTFSSIITADPSSLQLGPISTRFDVLNNTILGSDLPGLVDGYQNAALGENSLSSLTTGTYNSALGELSAENITEGISNTVIGQAAANFLTTGDRNILVGAESGTSKYDGTDLATGSDNTLIGFRANTETSSTQHSIAIGSGAVAGDNELVIGTDTNTSTGTIYGAINFPDGMSTNSLIIDAPSSGFAEMTANSSGQILVSGETVLTNADIGSSAGQIPVLGEDYKPFGFLIYDTVGEIQSFTDATAREELNLDTLANAESIWSYDFSDASLLDSGTLSTDRLPATIEATLIPRNGTDAIIDTVVLDTGELAVTNDTGQIRIGDGSTAGGEFTYGSLSSDNTWTGDQNFTGRFQVNGFDTLYFSPNNGSVFLGTEVNNLDESGGSAFQNSAVGFDALASITTGELNTASGSNALGLLTTGNANTVVGQAAGGGVTSGDHNVFIGQETANTPDIDTESNNVFIGYRAGNQAPDGVEDSIVIGRDAQPTTSNELVIGTDAHTSTGTIYGAINFPDGISADTLEITEQSADPADPAEGATILWQSDGTGFGDDGDVIVKITSGGVTKTHTLIDFSAITDEQP
jgi:hypothetical protein